jgi:hypothetical protein
MQPNKALTKQKMKIHKIIKRIQASPTIKKMPTKKNNTINISLKNQFTVLTFSYQQNSEKKT